MNRVKQLIYQTLERILHSRGLEIQSQGITRKQIERYLSDQCREFMMISTIPKSGTHRCALFFFVLDHLLRGNSTPDISEYKAGYIEQLSSIGVSLKIGHSSNPFKTLDYRREDPTSWFEVPLYVKGWDSAREVFDAMVESGANKIIHIYRNPLDQSISWFHMKKAQLPEGADYFTDDCGRKIPLDERAFLRHLTLPLWVKTHGSFAFHSEQDGKHALLIPYERLMQQPDTEFGRILEFFGVQLGENGADLIQRAVELTSRDKVRALEDSQKDSLLNIGGLNQEVKTEWRHARDGSSGQWESVFGEEDVEFARRYLEDHGLNLNDYL